VNAAKKTKKEVEAAEPQFDFCVGDFVRAENA